MNEKRSLLPILIPVIGSAGIVLALWQSSNLVEVGLFFRGTDPIPLRSNPLLLSATVLGLLVLTSVVALVASRFPRLTGLTLALVCGPLVLSTVGLLASVHPGTGPLVIRDQVEGIEISRPGSLFSTPLFFPHGKATLSQSERKRLDDISRILVGCSEKPILVRGFASSARFPEYSDRRNRELANARAKYVATLLSVDGDRPVRILKWDSYSSMAAQRRVRDLDIAGGRLIEAERLNRRVEIIWGPGLCGLSDSDENWQKLAGGVSEGEGGFSISDVPKKG